MDHGVLGNLLDEQLFTVFLLRLTRLYSGRECNFSFSDVKWNIRMSVQIIEHCIWKFSCGDLFHFHVTILQALTTTTTLMTLCVWYLHVLSSGLNRAVQNQTLSFIIGYPECWCQRSSATQLPGNYVRKGPAHGALGFLIYLSTAKHTTLEPG